MQGAAAEEDPALAFGDGEVANVLADLRIGAAQQGAVAGEGVDELEDVDGVRELGLAYDSSSNARTRG